MPAAAMSWVAPTVLGALGLYGQSQASRRANQMAQHGQDLQDQALARQQQAFDMLAGQYKDNLASGVYNPAQRIANFDKAIDHAATIASKNLGASALSMGYRTGDTTPLDAARNQSEEYQLQRAQGEEAIQNQVHQQQLQDLSAVNGGSAVLGSAVNAGLQDYQLGLNQQNAINPAGILASLAPFLSKIDWGNHGSGQVAAATGTGTNFGGYQQGLGGYQSPLSGSGQSNRWLNGGGYFGG